MAKDFTKEQLNELVGLLEDFHSSDLLVYDSHEDRQVSETISIIYDLIDNK